MLQVYTLEKSETWDAIVESFADHDVYWLSGYVKAFKMHGDGEPMLFFYQDAFVRGINVVMKRDISTDARFADKLPENQYYDFTSPYGYGGWIIEGEETRTLFQEYKAWCVAHGVISEFVRFHPVVKNHLQCMRDYEVVELGCTVTMDISTPEVIWENLTSKNRNMIRKAQKNNIIVNNNASKASFETFRTIYDKTMQHDKADQYYYFSDDFYASIQEDLSGRATIFSAEYGGVTVAAAIILNENHRLNYHLSGMLREFSYLAPTNIILYEAAIWGCENGCQTFYLGGGVGSKEDSLYKFKKGFNRTESDRFYIGKKTFIEEKYDYLTDIRKGEIEIDQFFPRYRG